MLLSALPFFTVLTVLVVFAVLIILVILVVFVVFAVLVAFAAFVILVAFAVVILFILCIICIIRVGSFNPARKSDEAWPFHSVLVNNRFPISICFRGQQIIIFAHNQ
jgi:hypothetical protein